VTLESNFEETTNALQWRENRARYDKHETRKEKLAER